MSEVKSFLGLIQFYAAFAPNLEDKRIVEKKLAAMEREFWRTN